MQFITILAINNASEIKQQFCNKNNENILYFV